MVTRPCHCQHILIRTHFQGESTWDHPCDDYYRKQYEEAKREKLAKASVSNPTQKDVEREAVRELIAAQRGHSTSGASLHSSGSERSVSASKRKSASKKKKPERAQASTPRATASTGKPPLSTPKSLPALSPLAGDRPRASAALPSLDDSPPELTRQPQTRKQRQSSRARAASPSSSSVESSSDDEMTRAMAAAVHTAQVNLGTAASAGSFGSKSRRDSSRAEPRESSRPRSRRERSLSPSSSDGSVAQPGRDAAERRRISDSVVRKATEAAAARVEAVKREHQRQQEAAAREHMARMQELQAQWEQEEREARQQHDAALRAEDSRVAQQTQRAQAAAAAQQRELSEQQRATTQKLTQARAEYNLVCELADLAHAVEHEKQRLEEARSAADTHMAEIRQRRAAAESDARKALAAERERVDKEIREMAASLDEAHTAHFEKLEALRQEVAQAREETHRQLEAVRQQRAAQLKSLSARSPSAASSSSLASPGGAPHASAFDDAIVTELQAKLQRAESQLAQLRADVQTQCSRAHVSTLQELALAAATVKPRRKPALRIAPGRSVMLPPSGKPSAVQQPSSAEAAGHAQLVLRLTEQADALRSELAAVQKQQAAVRAERDELQAQAAAGQRVQREHAASLARVEALKAQVQRASQELADATQAKLLLQDQHFQVQAELLGSQSTISQLQGQLQAARQAALAATAAGESTAAGGLPASEPRLRQAANLHCLAVANDVSVQRISSTTSEPAAAARPSPVTTTLAATGTKEPSVPAAVLDEAAAALSQAGPAALCVHHCATAIRAWCRSECGHVHDRHEQLCREKAAWRAGAGISKEVKHKLNSSITALNEHSALLKHVISEYDTLAAVRDDGMQAVLALAVALRAAGRPIALHGAASDASESDGSTLVSIESPALWRSGPGSRASSSSLSSAQHQADEDTLSFDVSRTMAESGMAAHLAGSLRKPSTWPAAAEVRSAVAALRQHAALACESLRSLSTISKLPGSVSYYVACTLATCLGEPLAAVPHSSADDTLPLQASPGLRFRPDAARPPPPAGPIQEAGLAIEPVSSHSPVLAVGSPARPVLANSQAHNIRSPQYHSSSRSPAPRKSQPTEAWIAAKQGTLELAHLHREARQQTLAKATSRSDTVGQLGARLEQRAVELALLKNKLLLRKNKA